MDTSKQYIEMCKQAQKYLDPRTKDICERDTIFYDGNWGMYFKEQFYLEGTYSNGDLIIWEREIFKLYHQDQLQEIYLTTFKMPPINLVYEFGIYLNRFAKELINLCSQEQLWLSFVMKNKFNKTWSGNDWVEND